MDWLTKERIKIYPRMCLAFYVIIYGYWIFSGVGIIDGQGKPIGSDFLGYWAASKIIILEKPSDVYASIEKSFA